MKSHVDFTKVLSSTKSIALRYVKNNEIAEEIAQMVAIQYHLNIDKVNPESSHNWIYTVTKNLCMDHYRKIVKEGKLSEEYKFYRQLCSLEEDAIEHINTDIDSYDFIKKDDKILLKKYYEHKDYTKLAQSSKKKIKYLKEKIYHLEQEIKLYHIFSSQIVHFTPVPRTRFTTNLHNFIKRLKEALTKNDFSTLSRYLENCQVNPEVNKLELKQFLTSKIAKLSNKRYQLTICYSDGGKVPKFVLLIFTINQENNIKILEFPIFPTSVLKVHDRYLDPVKKSKTLIDSKGNYNKMYGSYDEMKENDIGVEIQKKEDF